MLRAELCDYSNAYRAADGTITVDKKGSRNINIDAYNKELIFKPNRPFTSCIIITEMSQIIPLMRIITLTNNKVKIF